MIELEKKGIQAIKNWLAVRPAVLSDALFLNHTVNSNTAVPGGIATAVCPFSQVYAGALVREDPFV